MYLLGGAGEGEAPNVCGNHVWVVLRHCDVTGISVHQPLVVDLDEHSSHTGHQKVS